VSPELAARIRQNLAEVRGRIAEAARRSGRRADEIALVAVTKYVGEPAIRALVEAGCRVLGESRPQQLWERAGQLADLPVEWHLVGHLQRNKVRRTVPVIHWLDSADSLALIAEVDRRAAELGRPIPTLLEVNISGEAAKHGFEPAALGPCLDALAQFRHVEIRGLMGMASLEGGLDAARRDFAALRQLRDRLRANCPDAIRLDELSMGMSGDFEVAIEEGATVVRVGSALFEGVTP
jgi:pyridoxal phosphate enzyme (YggS family)